MFYGLLQGKHDSCDVSMRANELHSQASFIYAEPSIFHNGLFKSLELHQMSSHGCSNRWMWQSRC